MGKRLGIAVLFLVVAQGQSVSSTAQVERQTVYVNIHSKFTSLRLA
jgi:hypothetical protein